MKFSTAVFSSFCMIGLSLVSARVVERNCAEADRYGDIIVSPTTGLHIGDTITITTDLTCAVQTYHNVPTQLDYFIEVPPTSTTPKETVWLGEHPTRAGVVSDSLTTQIPNADFVSGQTYNLVFRNEFFNNGVPGRGGVLVPVTFA